MEAFAQRRIEVEIPNEILVAHELAKPGVENKFTPLVQGYAAPLTRILQENLQLGPEDAEELEDAFRKDLEALLASLQPASFQKELVTYPQKSLSKVFVAVQTFRVNALDAQMRIFKPILPDWPSLSEIMYADEPLTRFQAMYDTLRQTLTKEKESVEGVLSELFLEHLPHKVDASRIQNLVRSTTTLLPEAWYVHAAYYLAATRPFNRAILTA